ncbi:MltA-interacting MipA family protein [Photobacterium jeanii]|uniref:MltA-interacting MipA family protein n=1 Tax=Photobacterium jeanii TaxID=858640 RepID=A0A178KKN3_9GAMM|nr:MipA/OmpV family protein [Photobacterium jeanii]OAN17938.1 MltA-interacting MipA family protein [Photobacterium jeanii]
MKHWLGLALSATAVLSSASYAQTEQPTLGEQTSSVESLREHREAEKNWGIAAVIRQASIPYSQGAGVDDSSVATFVPMMFYKGDNFYINGTETGYRLYTKDQFSVGAVLRMHFIDIPAAYQNQIGGDTGMGGLQFRYQWDENVYGFAEVVTDPEAHMQANLQVGAKYELGDWYLHPSATLINKTDDYNSHYYGINREKLESGTDIKVGSKVRYHVASNFYLLGGAYVTRFDKAVRQSQTVNDDWHTEFYAGFGFFNDASKPRRSSIDTKPYLRVAHGWATPSDMGEILTGNTVKDKYNNQLSSVFYGHPLTDELFGIPLDIYLTPGLVTHWQSEVQDFSTELVMAIKAYYTVNWPVKWRFGVAEGLSYVNSITYIEGSEMERKGYEPSKLLNYIDLSLDVNIGDLVNVPKLDNVWLGYSMHHRSAIFESASQFGRIKGGSNYNTVYLQFDF